MIAIRDEIPTDAPAIRTANEAAFGGTTEANIVDAVRRNCPDAVSLLASDGERVVGHVLFSPATITGSDRVVEGVALGPIAVLPEFQRRGIGSDLIRAGIARLRERGTPFVIVLGHPGYYPRFGFEPASRRGIRCEWPVPDKAFLILVLDEAALRGLCGLAKYRPEFVAAL